MAHHETNKAIADIRSKLLEISGQVFASPRQRKATLSAIHKLAIELEQVVRQVDDVRLPMTSINPSTPTFVGRVISSCLLEQRPVALGQIPEQRFYGSGVYAIFYNGAFEPYRPLSKKKQPIYVGKADPISREALTPRKQGTVLWNRLCTHAKNIGSVSGISLKDFTCRYLVVGTGWEGAAEDYLIHFFKPIWNKQEKVCYGFGKHGDSATTRANSRSPWDTLHPGRAWATSADNKPSKLSEGEIIKKITAHFEKYPPKVSAIRITDTIDDIDQIT